MAFARKGIWKEQLHWYRAKKELLLKNVELDEDTRRFLVRETFERLLDMEPSFTESKDDMVETSGGDSRPTQLVAVKSGWELVLVRFVCRCAREFCVGRTSLGVGC